jgi:hypothetical protein
METEKITLKKYLKNIFGMGFILFGGIYLIAGLKPALAGLGIFWITEHIYSWGEFSFYDFLGHEWLGFLILIILSILCKSWIGAIFILIGVIINLNFKTKLSSELINIIKFWSKK